MTKELYKQYRPKLFKDIVGQDEAVKMLTQMVKRDKVPNAICLSGPSGTGKTTLARILAKKLGCSGLDTIEINVADFRGIDTVREIRNKMSLYPLGGKAKVWILDECHTLRSDAQNAFLKILEDGSDHAYFMLATTEPNKLIATVRNRCTHIKTKSVDSNCMEKLIDSICKQEKKKICTEVKNKIVETANGSPRKALVFLNSVLELDKEEDQLNIIQDSDSEKQAIELCRLLIRPTCQWKEVAALIKSIDEEPESIRRLMLGYLTAVALNGGMLDRVMKLIDLFSNNYYDAGKAGLVWSCFHAIGTKRR